MRDPKVIRNFQPYTHTQRADKLASVRQGYRQRLAVGEFFYTHADIPGIAFRTRKAAEAALPKLREQNAYEAGAFTGRV